MKRIQLILTAIATISLLTLSTAQSNEPPIAKTETVESRVISICRQQDGPDLKIHELIVSAQDVCIIGEAKNRQLATTLRAKIQEAFGSDLSWLNRPHRMDPDGSVTFRIEVLNDGQDMARHRAAKVHQALAETNLSDQELVGIRELESTTERLILKFDGVNRRAANRFLKALAAGLPTQEVMNPPMKMDRSGTVAGELEIRAKALLLPANQAP